ncbi:MAG: zinc ribbon domain-containing protein [Methanobrevibacter olleyae]|uniref:Zinc ribbon domain-containing protein n=1 Tax=Methanobrevibacter olleyae TaxID=294671 RepID=A0A8T3VVP6_METOL|nr:zinc ribbon domain-containing protein [Methanobrevibacter olleyae]
MAKYCGNCGRELSDEAKFCPNCGQEYIPRYKADHYSSSQTKNEFDGPFDDFDNKSSTNPFESSSKRTSSNSSGNAKSSSKSSESFPCGKVCLVLFIVMMLFSAISYYAYDNTGDYDTSIIEDSADNLSVDKYRYDRSPHEDWGDMDSNGHYRIPIDKTAYLSGEGEVQLIDSNHSYNIESEGFNITEYETYYVSVDDNDWYVLNIFKCKFETPSQRQVYSTDLDDGDPIIIYGGKGDYSGYGIIMPNSSDNETYKNLDFLESIFYYNSE